MVTAELDTKFRQMTATPPNWGLSNPGEANKIWGQVIHSPDVVRVYSQSLFIPTPLPDPESMLYLRLILDHLRTGQPLGFETAGDVRVTEAEVRSVEVSEEANGPRYLVTYAYLTDEAEFEVTYVFGYDQEQCQLWGWPRPALDAYWNVGQTVRCHYLASEPETHRICQP